MNSVIPGRAPAQATPPTFLHCLGGEGEVGGMGGGRAAGRADPGDCLTYHTFHTAGRTLACSF